MIAFSLVECLGSIGTALTVAAYAMSSLHALRLMAIGSSLAFLAYGYATASDPVLLMELVLLPINLWRLTELRPSRA